MPTEELTILTDAERLALCGALLRVMRADRYATGEEREALVAIVAEVFAARSAPPQSQVTAYREPGIEQPLADASDAEARAWIERAERELPDDASVAEALRTVTRPEARRLIYDAAFSLAAVDTVNEGERVILDELADAWKLPREER